MTRVIDVLPELAGEEMVYIQSLLNTMPPEKASSFATVYRMRRRDPLLILILAAIGLFGFAGLHRMLTDQIGLGIIYLLTLGLCFIGTIVDMINYQKIALEYNGKIAREIATMV